MCVCVCGAVLWPVIQDPVFVSHSDKQLPEAQEITYIHLTVLTHTHTHTGPCSEHDQQNGH